MHLANIYINQQGALSGKRDFHQVKGVDFCAFGQVKPRWLEAGTNRREFQILIEVL